MEVNVSFEMPNVEEEIKDAFVVQVFGAKGDKGDSPSEVEIQTALADYLTENPIDTEYIADGAVTYAKLDDSAKNAFLISDTATGSIATFVDGADNVPMDSVVCHINPVQSGSGDPSPENERPISGFTGLTVSRSGEDTSDPTEFPISWQTEAGTVYGCEFNPVSGVLTVDRASVDLGTLSWVSETSTKEGLFRTASHNYMKYLGELMCSQYKGVKKSQSSALSDGEISVTNSQSIALLRICDVSKTELTASQFKTAMNGVQLVYELANPITYQLTPTQIASLLGTNNVWHDGNGNTDVIYKADTKLYIDKKIAEAVSE